MSSTESAPPAAFDRRSEDVNTKSLGTELRALEQHVHEQMTPDLRANTILTKQVHEAVFGRDGDEGIQANVQGLHEALFGNGSPDQPGIEKKVNEMFAAYATAKNGVRLLGKLGDAAMSVSDTIERRPKTILMGLLGGVASYGFATTGKAPEWIQYVVRLLM